MNPSRRYLLRWHIGYCPSRPDPSRGMDAITIDKKAIDSCPIFYSQSLNCIDLCVCVYILLLEIWDFEHT